MVLGVAKNVVPDTNIGIVKMKRFITTMAALALLLVIVFTVGCKKDSADPNGGNGGGGDPTSEGIYLGIIGFNQYFTNKEISLLNNATLSSFHFFIDNLSMEDGTGLYYADYTALKKLKEFPKPSKLNNVALVTFTDGLDNVSLNSETNPEHYTSTNAYCSALNDKIKFEQIHGKNVTAYTIGIKGPDVNDDDEFHNNLNALASDPDNVFEVTDMNEALQRFSEIAESLYSVSTSSTLKLRLPGGYNDGVQIRLTFDNVNSAINSNKYIECTYKWTNNGRRLENITYHGLINMANTLNSVSQTGLYYDFEFNNMTHPNGSVISQSDIQHLQLWRQVSSGAWQRDVEFTPANSSQVTEDQSSALIMLVLDCTTSLGNQFTNMKTGAKRFVETLVTSNGGGGGGTTYNTPTVITSDVYDITNYSAYCTGNVTNNGGSAITARGVCWSTNHYPTVNDYHAVDSIPGMGNFTVYMSGLYSNTTYYARAYAVNSMGVSYGQEISFTTTSGGGYGTNIMMCNGYIYMTPGVVYNFYDSGGSSYDYSNNENYTYTFYAPVGKRVNIDFDYFVTESGYDIITIDGDSYSGSYNLGSFVSSGNTMTISFHSDGGVTYAGWSATVSSVY